MAHMGDNEMRAVCTSAKKMAKLFTLICDKSKIASYLREIYLEWYLSFTLVPILMGFDQVLIKSKVLGEVATSGWSHL